MNTRRIVGLLWCICLTGVVHAQQEVSMTEAENVAVNFMASQVTPSFQLRADTTYVSRDSDGRPLLYEVIMNNGTPVIVAGSKSCTPILAYGYTHHGASILDDSIDLPDAVRGLLHTYRGDVERSYTDSTIRATHNQSWFVWLNENSARTRTNRNAVSPLLQSLWGQSFSNDSVDADAYNYYAPLSNDTCGNLHCQAGCGAVAMGQVMRYYKYPVQDNMMFMMDWCNMPYKLIVDDPHYDTYRYVISKFLYHCGASVGMSWCDGSTGCGSSTDLNAVKYAMQERFKFETRIISNTSGGNYDEWVSRLKEELDNHRPVIYSINMIGVSGGHIMVCDGYDADNLFHFNFGFGGNLDGYYSLNYFDIGGYVSPFLTHAMLILQKRSEEEIDYCAYNAELNDFYSEFYSVPDNAQFPAHEYVPTGIFNLVSSSINHNQDWRTIPSGEYALYDAHKSITLRDGFHARRGSTFVARITPCPDCMIMNTNISSDTADGTPVQDDDLLWESCMGDYIISPNPARDMITISGGIPIAGVYVFDCYGRCVLATECDPRRNSIQIDMSGLPNGVYIVRITDPKGQYTHKKFFHY